MAVDETYTDPSTGGSIDLNTGQPLTETVWDKVLSNLKHIGHTAGLTWVGFTPTVTQSGAVSVTVTRARYAIVGKTATVQIVLVMTGAGGGSTAITVASIPAAIAPAYSGTWMACGSAVVNDTSVAAYPCTVIAASSSTFQFAFGGSAGTASPVGASPAFTLATNDSIWLTATYEI